MFIFLSHPGQEVDILRRNEEHWQYVQITSDKDQSWLHCLSYQSTGDPCCRGDLPNVSYDSKEVRSKEGFCDCLEERLLNSEFMKYI